MKRIAMWGLGLALVVFAVLSAPLLSDPLGRMILYAAITGKGYGHPQKPPALAGNADVRGSWTGKPNEGDRRWKAIVRKNFPIGSDVRTMLMTLRDQGFKVSTSHDHASYDWGGMPCRYTVLVAWKEDAAHRIADIAGGAFSGCL